MKLRGQILIASLLLTVLPLSLVMLVVRHNVARRFDELDTRRVGDQISLTRQDLDRQSRQIVVLLDALAAALENDNRFRLAAGGLRDDLRGYLVDYAPRTMSLMNLDLLLIQDTDGTVLSSGHFRGSFGLVEPDLPRLLGQVTGGEALLPARAANGPFLALARTRTLELGDRTLHLTAGIRLDEDNLRRLGQDEDLAVMLIWPDGMMSSDPTLAERYANTQPPEVVEFQIKREGAIVGSASLPLISSAEPQAALLLVIHDQGFMRRLLSQLNLNLALVMAAAMMASVWLAVLLSNRISRPLRQLAASTEHLDLDNLEADFDSHRQDEVGHLSRLLGQMTRRLRESVGRLRSAEHRATLGEVARQVNHDIRNGLTPLRNVLRHLGQVAEDDPEQLPEVFGQRRSTLDSSLDFLEALASHYAKLSPARQQQGCRLAQVVEEALEALPAGSEVLLQNRVGSNLPEVLADPVSLRRIFDNLLHNALESLSQGTGTIAINAFLEEDPHLEEMRIIVEIADNGVGIPAENLDLVFNDFFTTRSEGTGLGLSNVRRLAADCGAQVRVQSQVGQGTTFTLSFPLNT